MLIFELRELVFTAVGILIWMFSSGTLVTAETMVEVSFTVNPVNTGSQTAMQCKVWDLGPNQQVWISKLDRNNDINTVFVRDSALLPDTPDHIFLNILPPQPDGSTPYHLTILEVDKVADEGIYFCYVLTVEGTATAVATDSLKLEVIVDAYLPPDGYPMCSLTENRLSFYAGEEITLTCSSMDGKPSISLLWIRNDRMEIPENQTMTQNGKIVKNVTRKLVEQDNGTVFKCIIISTAFPSNGRECSIGPIAVWKGPGKGTVTVSYNNTDEFNPRTIAGLSETVFVMVIVAAGIIVLVTIILVIVFCVRAYSCACLIRKRKSYTMHGHGNKDDSTLRGDGTLTAGVELQYIPSRPAPAPPQPPSYVESQRDSMRQQHYTQNIATSGGAKRLSAVESALLLAVTRSVVTRDQASLIIEENPDTEIIYANTSRSSSVVDLHKMVNEGDTDSGVVNPTYDGNNESPSGLYTGQSSHSTSASQIIYHNTSELPINTQSAPQDIMDRSEYAKVDKSRSRSSTMESVKKQKSTVEPEAVTTLDTEILYHNTADLAINTSNPIYPSPPPIPVNPPSPISKEPQKPDRQLSSVGVPEKPAFKPPPPPASPGATLHKNRVFDEGTEKGDTRTPTNPVPPKKPTYKI